eukprot:2035030-Alexandrium_andersonii.AAC.1
MAPIHTCAQCSWELCSVTAAPCLAWPSDASRAQSAPKDRAKYASGEAACLVACAELKRKPE